MAVTWLDRGDLGQPVELVECHQHGRGHGQGQMDDLHVEQRPGHLPRGSLTGSWKEWKELNGKNCNNSPVSLSVKFTATGQISALSGTRSAIKKEMQPA